MKRLLAGLAAMTTAAALWLSPGVRKKAPAPVNADSLMLAAEVDSFPVIVARDTLGRSAATLRVGEGTVLCGLARNRYTGEIRLYIPADAPVGADEYLATVCERARLLYAAERGA